MNTDHDDEVIGVGEWILTYIILIIPLVGLFYALLGMFLARKASKRNYLRASVILAILMLALYAGGIFLYMKSTGMSINEFAEKAQSGELSSDLQKKFGKPDDSKALPGFVNLEQTDGKTIYVKVISVRGTMISVEQPSGQRMLIGTSSLTPKSQEKAKAQTIEK